MKTGRKKTALVLAAAMGLSLTGGFAGSETLTAQASGFEPHLDAEEDAVVNIIGSLNNFESLEAVISDFAEYYPNCEVLYSVLGTGDYRELIGSRLASDETVGLFTINNLIYSNDTVAGFCANLLEEDMDLSAIQQEALDAYTMDEKLFALPMAMNSYGLIVNTTLLENEGLSVPENYDEFLEVCAALKEKGYTPIQGYPGNVGYLIRSMAYVSISDAYPTSEELAGLIAGEDGCAEVLRPAFEIVRELVDSGYIDTAVNETHEDSYNGTILKFFEGDVPFLIASTETYSGTKKRETKSEHYSAEPFEYEFISSPLGEDGAYSFVENWLGLALNENCPDKEWAAEFLRFLATDEEINELASIKGLPSAASESDDDRYTALYEVPEANLVVNNTYYPETVETAIYNAVMALVAGEADVDGAISMMEAELSGSAG